MSRNISSENQAAAAARKLVARDFLWLVVKHRITGAPVNEGLWSDLGTITADVIDPDTGIAATRSWYGAGTLVSIGDIPLTANLQVQTVSIVLSQIGDKIDEIIRTYDCKQAKVEIFRGLYNPDTRLMVAPAVCRFTGFVDVIDIDTGGEGEEGATQITAVSHTQEMTRSNPDTRSHASQILRSATDKFHNDSQVVGVWEMFWGSQKGKVPSQEKKKFLGIF